MSIIENIHRSNTNKHAYASGIHTSNGAGMSYIRAIRMNKYSYIKTNHRFVGAFGIVGDDGVEHIYKWRIHKYRQDTRHGVIDKPEPMSKYAESLFDSMFKGWN